MFCPVLCFSCGRSVGHVHAIFVSMRAKIVRQTLGERATAPGMAAVDPGLQVDCSKIFDKLGINHDCCRKTLATNMDFFSYR
jgi:DNA-directed RNA polymerase subunit N (RpoN/RPB10)